MPYIESPPGSGSFVEVAPTSSAVTWATLAEIAAVTGRAVPQATRDAAAAVIESVTGLIEAVVRADVSDRDRHWLKLATAYQAAFMLDNPDIFSREDVTSASQDGESVAFRNVDAHLLAPLARKAIRRLSWRGLTRPGDVATSGAGRLPITSEAFDDSLPWRRM